MLVAATEAPCQGRDFSVSGDVALATRYVDKELSVYTPGPALQPDLTVTHDATGCFATGWLSAGLVQSGGDEIDVTLGCSRPVGRDFTLNAFAAEYLFRGGRWTVLSAGLARRAVSVQAYYYLPHGFGRPGVRLLGSYSRAWKADTVSASIIYDTGGENEVRPMTAVLIQDEHTLSRNVHVVATAQLPLVRHAGDPRRAQVWAALLFKF